MLTYIFAYLILLTHGSTMSFIFPNEDNPQQSLCNGKNNFRPEICSCGPKDPHAECICTNRYPSLNLTSVVKTITSLKIYNCSLRITPGVFQSTYKLNTLILENTTLTLNTYSLKIGPTNAQLTLHINNSFVGNIPENTFVGGVKNIQIANSVINTISSSAFSNLKNLNELKLIDSSISKVQRNAFHGIMPEYFVLQRCSFSNITEKGFNMSVKYDIKILNTKFYSLSSKGLMFGRPSRYLVLTENYFHKLPPFAVVAHMGQKGEAVIKSNTFKYLSAKAFDSLTSGSLELLLNTFTYTEPSSLSFTKGSSSVKFLANTFNITCACDLRDWFAILLSKKGDNSSKAALDSVHTNSLCHEPQGQSITVGQYEKTVCEGSASNLTYIIIGIISVIVLILIVIIVSCRLHRRKLNNERKRLKDNEHKSDFAFVAPDTKLYKETEVEYVIEKVETLPDEMSSNDFVEEMDIRTGTVRQSCPPVMRAQFMNK